MKTLEQIWIETQLGVAGSGNIIRWAGDVIDCGDDLAFDTDVQELASLPAGDPRKADEASAYLRRIVERCLPDFRLSSPNAEAYARDCLKMWCERLVAEEITPYQFCQIVSPIEEAFAYPKWLGNFYNKCDWVEPHYKPVDFRHLYHYAEEYLAALSKGLDPS